MFCQHTHFGLGNIEKLTELLNGSGCDVNSADKDGYTALHFAAALNEVQCAMLLVKVTSNRHTLLISIVWR